MTSITELKSALGITDTKAEVWTVVSSSNGQTKLQLGNRTMTVQGIYQGKVIVSNGNVINSVPQSNTAFHLD